MIREVFLMRAIACICIVLLHSLGTVKYQYDLDSTIFDSIRLLLTFGTPTFIFISELVLARNYRTRYLPKYFLRKRVKFILLPYIAFALIYAVIGSISNISNLPNKIINNLLGGYHGYFILIIFQFYFLHIIFSKYAKYWSAKIVLIVSLIINIAYLAVFNFIPAPQSRIGIYLWEDGYSLPFVGWLFYFTFAYYCGMFYENFSAFLKKYKKEIFVLLPLTISPVLIFYTTGILSDISSKRVDILPFTISLILSMSVVFQNNKPIPKFMLTISRYSFGVYLLHIFYIQAINKLLSIVSNDGNWMFDTITFAVGSIILSIISVHIINKFKFGQYIVGKIGISYKVESKVSLEVKTS